MAARGVHAAHQGMQRWWSAVAGRPACNVGTLLEKEVLFVGSDDCGDSRLAAPSCRNSAADFACQDVNTRGKLLCSNKLLMS